jgi:hypothetical protein
MARSATMVGVRPDGDSAWGESWAVAWRALLASRVLVLASGAVAVGLFGLSPRHTDFDPAGVTTPFGPLLDALVSPLARWDSTWFMSIAQDGYGDGAREAFFPLYPLLLAVVGTTGEMLIAGAVLSTVFAAVALTVLHRLVTVDYGADVARGAVLAMAFMPMSFFLSAVYSESLFLMLSIGAVYAARTDRWAWAGILGFLAATTRSAGVLLVVPLFALWWDARGRRRPDLAWLVLVPAGVGAYCLYLWASGGDPQAPFAAQEVWFRSFAGPFAGAWDGAVAAYDGARQLLSGSREPVFFEQAGGDPFVVARHNIELFLWLGAGLWALALGLRRLPLAYLAYVVVALALPLSYPVDPQPLMSLPRFLLVLFPLAIAVAAWAQEGRRRGPLLLGASAVLLAVYTGIFATWHWVA